MDVFVGFAFGDEREQELLATSRRGMSIAANQYQKGFLSGLSQPVRVLSTISTGSFPRMNTRLVFKRESGRLLGNEVSYLPFLNFYIIRDWMFEHGLYRELKKIVEEQEHTTIYIYSLHIPFLNVMRKLKKRYGSRVHFCVIIPDLAGKYGLIRKGIKGIKDRLDEQKKMSMPNIADSFVFLAEAAKELFDSKPCAVIEGFLPQCEFNYENQRQPKSVLYTGSLNRAYGFGTLLDAFASIPDEEAQLWICGSGDMEEEIKRAEQKDPRIQYKGFLPKSEIADLQTKCDVLVNPRTDEGEYTKYSFPSKTMEYLLSGSKVVMHRLSGVPEEYYNYIRVPDNNTSAAMAKVLIEAWADTGFYADYSRNQVGWIRQNKNAREQVSRALEEIGLDGDCE